MQDIRLTVFNIILNILEVNENKASVNLYGKKVVGEQPFLEFRFEFTTQLPIADTLIELIKAENIFGIYNLKNLFSRYPLDIVVSAHMIYKLKGELSYKTNDQKMSTLTMLVPVKAMEKKVIDGKIIARVHFLLAEDHVMNKVVLKNTLKAWSDKINIKEVNTAAEVLKELKKNSYDLILLNVKLPDSSGLELVKKIKEKLNIPILGISSYPSAQEKQLCLEAGMNGYLQKPYNNQTLFEEILQVLA